MPVKILHFDEKLHEQDRLDEDVKNAWKWSWLGWFVGRKGEPTYEGNGKLGDMYQKCVSPGDAFCTVCHKIVTYGKEGGKALVEHARGTKHLKQRRLMQSNTPLAGKISNHKNMICSSHSHLQIFHANITFICCVYDGRKVYKTINIYSLVYRRYQY